MDAAIGIKGNGFVLLATDANSGRSILIYKRDLDKIVRLSDRQLMATVGPQADCAVFGEFIQKNLRLYELENQIPLSTFGIANFVRGELAKALRKGPYQTNLLLGGVDDQAGSSLFWLDYLGTMQEVNFGAHGYAGNFVLSILDREWVEGLSEEQALDLLRKCVKELETRFLVSMPKWTVKVVDAESTRVVEL